MGMKKLTFILVLVAVFCGVGSYDQLVCAADYKMVNDMCDRKVEVPVQPKSIACMHCISPEKIMTLGKGDCIRLMSEQSPWAYRLFPEIKNASSNKGVTPEQMLEMGIDFVLYTPGMTNSDPYRSAGLTTVCAFSPENRPMTLDEYRENFKRQISLFGDLLGPEAKARADKYNQYFDRKVARILAITSKIDPKDRPSVYYGGRGNDLLNSQGKGSVMHWNTEVSGGKFLPRALPDNHARATRRQVLSWDPDIILLSGYCDSMDIVSQNPVWASMRAVQNGKVYRLPKGVYPWDHASGEGVLLMIYMAKLFHPDQFRDWDMVEEMKRFYAELYGRKITDSDAKRILQCLPPL
jgi:iron complex transport system substrate-binding protein